MLFCEKPTAYDHVAFAAKRVAPLSFRGWSENSTSLLKCTTLNALPILGRSAKVRLERRLALATIKHVTVRRDLHLDEPGCGPVFAEQAPEDRLEVGADLNSSQFVRAALANLIGLTD
jgi:hypothetical protein